MKQGIAEKSLYLPSLVRREETLPSYTKCSYIPKRMKKQEEAGLLVGSIDRNEDLLSFKFMEWSILRVHMG